MPAPIFDLGRASAPRITVPHMLPSATLKASASAILLLSRLNRPPCTIAVYASPWSSPPTTQHSLPGGRYRLPGPDIHRLDLASFLAQWVSLNKAALDRHGSGLDLCHILGMPDAFPPGYELTTRPCTIHAGRHRWVITGNGKPVQTSMDSFETPERAHADGRIALEKLVKSSRIGQ